MRQFIKCGTVKFVTKRCLLIQENFIVESALIIRLILHAANASFSQMILGFEKAYEITQDRSKRKDILQIY